METVWHLMKAVAQRLSGRKIILRLEQPEAGVDGQVMHLKDGRALMYVNQSNTNDRILQILCHESYHAKNLQLLGKVNMLEASQSKDLPAFSSSSKEEEEADLQAEAWYQYAKSKSDNFIDQLYALLEMEE